MSFRIISGDISPDYKLLGNVLIADGHPPIAISRVSVLDYQEISHCTDYRLSWLRALPALVFGFLCFSLVGAIAFAAIAGLKIRQLYTFRITIRYYGSFIAVADKTTYKDFLQAYLDSDKAA
ncbi:hypothetical protein [Mitsuokella jalaludinii]|uniref:hypothetical protein n=1 Tax=Mitsuokella jalaludinii TaxID=187979 RepID=UPI0025864DBF|nr:hypothetical protein [uncultured Mitsuokella sp.]